MASKVLRRITRNQSSPCNKNISGKTSPSTIGSALPNSSTPSAPTSRTIPSWQDWPLIPRTGPGPAAPPSSTKSIRPLDFVAQPLLAVQPPTPTTPSRNLANRNSAPVAQPLLAVQPPTPTTPSRNLANHNSAPVAQPLLAVQPPTPTTPSRNLANHNS